MKEFFPMKKKTKPKVAHFNFSFGLNTYNWFVEFTCADKANGQEYCKHR